MSVELYDDRKFDGEYDPSFNTRKCVYCMKKPDVIIYFSQGVEKTMVSCRTCGAVVGPGENTWKTVVAWNRKMRKSLSSFLFAKPPPG